MRKILSLFLCLTLLMTLLAGCSGSETSSSSQQESETITVVDHGGITVEVPKKIDRIAVVGILPFPSVLAMYLGSAEKIVGMPPAAMSAAEMGLLGEIFPEILNAETGYTSGSDLNIEELMKLEPDVVFYLAGNTQWQTALEGAGIPAVGISTGKWDYDVLETFENWIQILSQIFPEQSKTEKVTAYSQEVYDTIQERVSGLKEEEKKDILFLYQYDDKQIITSGKHFFGQFWCDAVGGRNAAEEIEAENSTAVINMEQILAWDPDVVFLTNFTAAMPEDLYTNAIGGQDWSTVQAVKNQEVYKMPLGSYRSFTPGADTPVTLLWMAQKVYPDLFADIDLEQEVKDYYKEIYGVELTDEQVQKMYNPESHQAEGLLR